MVPFEHIRAPSEAEFSMACLLLSAWATQLAKKKTKKNNEEMNAIKMRTLKATEQNTPLGN